MVEKGHTYKKLVWIPNQVGNNSECAFGDDNGMVFGDEKVLGSSIKDFEDDSRLH